LHRYFGYFLHYVSRYFKIALFVFLAILLFGWLGSIQFSGQKEKSVANLKPAPDFTLQSLSGDQVSLSSFRGKTVYLKFWASWCGDCIKQVVPMRRLEESLAQDTTIVFLNVSVDTDKEAWKRSVARNKLRGVELLSLGGDEGNINTLYGVDEIPHYVWIGKDGKIREDHAPSPSEIDADYFKE
jgi:peroxiredoxin